MIQPFKNVFKKQLALPPANACMSGPRNSSTEIVYKALYDGEEYLPWGGQPTSSRHRQSAQQQQLDFSLKWGRGTPACNNQSSQEKTQSPKDTERQLTESGIKLQWEARARELEVSISGSRFANIQGITANNDIYKCVSNSNGNIRPGYPSWETNDNNMISKRNACERHKQYRMTPVDRTENWDFNSLYSSEHSPTANINKQNQCHSLNDHMNHRYSSVFDNMRLSNNTENPAWKKIESHSKRVRCCDEPTPSDNVMETPRKNDDVKENKSRTPHAHLHIYDTIDSNSAIVKEKNTEGQSSCYGKRMKELQFAGTKDKSRSFRDKKTVSKLNKRKTKGSKTSEYEEDESDHEQVKQHKKRKKRKHVSFLIDS